MIAPEYSLLPLHPAALPPARRWLILGTLALGVGGVFAGLLGASHQPFFNVALTVHVDLTVLVWFLTIAGMIFTLATQDKGWPALASVSFYSFALGAALIALSAFGGFPAYQSNYIPVIYSPMFFLALSLLLCGITGTALNLIFALKAADLRQPFIFGAGAGALILLIALRCFFVAYQELPASLSGQIYYEYAFWGGGHVLQFLHTQMLMLCWLVLARASDVKSGLKSKAPFVLFALNLIAAAAGILIYARHSSQSDELRNAFTMLMKHANGIAPLIMGIDILYGLGCSSAQKETRLPRAMLFCSIILFAAGGGLGYLIAGSNLVVPAHYHGSIVGITLTFMGLAYLLLPHFGFADVTESKLAVVQPFIYGGGMLCWLAGMAMLGFNNVPRKTPGSADSMGALAAGLKHGGDGIALIGGLLFVFIVLRAVCIKRKL